MTNLILFVVVVYIVIKLINVLPRIGSFKYDPDKIKFIRELKKTYLPYKTRQTLMTGTERILFENLRKVLEPKYDVYPQMKLDKIFYVDLKPYTKNYLGNLRRINQKSVDYLVVNRQDQSPVYAIELDDSSHEKDTRRDRDSFVDELFKINNLPLVRFSPGQYKIEELKIILSRYL